MKKIKFSALILQLASVLLIGACASHGGSKSAAPVEDRVSGKLGPVASAQAGVNKQNMGQENAGKPGYYTVKSGDTLIRIGLDFGQNWRDLARWNQLDRPSQIEVGQVLRVVPPVGATTAQVANPVKTAPSSATPIVAAPIAASGPSADDLNWIWPTMAGNVLAGFDESKNKGLDIGGNAGDAILAAADGRVVYAGAGLRGYGNLVILKHNDTFLSAYAHNQTILVKEDQSVVKGQKIAEMGQSDSDHVRLHFEIRRQGKPIDPAQYLPKR